VGDNDDNMSLVKKVDFDLNSAEEVESSARQHDERKRVIVEGKQRKKKLRAVGDHIVIRNDPRVGCLLVLMLSCI